MKSNEYLSSETFCTTLQSLLEAIEKGKVDKNGVVIFFSSKKMVEIRRELNCGECIFTDYCSEEYIACESF